MKTRVGWAVLLLAGVLSAGQAAADVYTWVDEDGTVHMQDDPPARGARARKVRLPPGEQAPMKPPAEAAPAGDASARAPREQPRSERPLAQRKPAPAVELYTTSWCPWCKRAREYFTSRGIAFTDHDIEKDAGALQRKLGLDGDERVPTAIIGDKVVRGFSPAEYQAALGAP